MRGCEQGAPRPAGAARTVEHGIHIRMKHGARGALAFAQSRRHSKAAALRSAASHEPSRAGHMRAGQGCQMVSCIGHTLCLASQGATQCSWNTPGRKGLQQTWRGCPQTRRQAIDKECWGGRLRGGAIRLVTAHIRSRRS